MEHRWRSEVIAGIRHVFRTLQLRRVVIAGAISTTVFGFAETITYAVAGSGLHQRPPFVGVLVAVQGIGAVIGGPTAAMLVRRVGEARLIATGLMAASAGALLQLPPAVAPVIAGFVTTGMAIPWIVVALISLTQRATPSQLQGRVYSAVDTLNTTPQTISIAPSVPSASRVRATTGTASASSTPEMNDFCPLSTKWPSLRRSEVASL